VSNVIENQIKFTTRDLELLPDSNSKYEIIDGKLYMTRAPHWKHQATIVRIGAFLDNWSRQKGLGVTIVNPGIIFSDTDNVIPDLVWISKERLDISVDESGHLTSAPELIVEVLSELKKDIQRDKDTKLKLYSNQGTQEYWIVDWRLQEMEIYRRNKDELVLTKTLLINDDIASSLLPEFSCVLRDVFN
jgi:Uma2 family endonuclease